MRRIRSHFARVCYSITEATRLTRGIIVRRRSCRASEAGGCYVRITCYIALCHLQPYGGAARAIILPPRRGAPRAGIESQRYTHVRRAAPDRSLLMLDGSTPHLDLLVHAKQQRSLANPFTFRQRCRILIQYPGRIQVPGYLGACAHAPYDSASNADPLLSLLILSGAYVLDNPVFHKRPHRGKSAVTNILLLRGIA